MKLLWRISKADIRLVRRVIEEQSDSLLVRRREEHSLAKDKPRVSKVWFWKCLVVALVTTQQRAGPGSRVQLFVTSRPFPFSYRRCFQAKRLSAYALKHIKAARLRFGPTLAKRVSVNFERLNGRSWRLISKELEEVRKRQTWQSERAAAAVIAENLQGFGPKQSRNLVQMLGLSRFEIPVDSRITKWLNQNGIFPFRLSPDLLGNPEYYNLVQDGIRELCSRARVYPCVLDAAVFASYDVKPWSSADFVR